MTLKTFQHTRVRTGLNSIKINNNFSKKRIYVRQLPPGSTVRVDSSFVKPKSLRVKMSEIKASSKFKEGQTKARNKFKRTRVKSGSKVSVNIS